MSVMIFACLLATLLASPCLGAGGRGGGGLGFGGQPGGGGSKITCGQDGSDYSYAESLAGDTRTIITNHCPNHPLYNLNPNTAIGSSTKYTLPASPTFVGSSTDSSMNSDSIDLTEQGGAIGILFNAAMLYSPYGGPHYGRVTGWTSSATYAEGNTFDQCGCHASTPDSPSYHCHVPPSCLLRQLGQQETAHSPQVGWAFDGFPVYGPRGPGGVMMMTCTQTGGTYGTDVCTDSCGGYYAEDPSVDEFTYRYYLMGEYNDGTSCDLPGCASPGIEYYPVSPVCFRGCCPNGVTCQSFLPTCPGTGTSNGYTRDYEASVPTINDLSVASGLPSHTDACSCDDLACKMPCTEHDWAEDTCGAGNPRQWSNSCQPGRSGGSTFSLGLVHLILAAAGVAAFDLVGEE